MNRKRWRTGLMMTAYLLVASLALASGGCLLIAAGAAGGAVAGYLYYQGAVCQTYHADLDRALPATRAALAALGMPITSDKREGNDAIIDSQTGDGTAVHIYIESRPAQVPSDGATTRICIRVGTLGDDKVSSRILNQVAAQIASPQGAAPPVPATPPTGPVQPPPRIGPTAVSPTPRTGPSVALPAETPAPPLAKPTAN